MKVRRPFHVRAILWGWLAGVVLVLAWGLVSIIAEIFG
jgi:hypothetical protein